LYLSPVNETLVQIAFWGFGGLCLVAAVALALTRKLIYAAFLLFVVLFSIAGLYVFAGAEFLAVSQVIIYVGGILILIIFGIMLTRKDLLVLGGTGTRWQWPGLAVAVGLGFLLWQTLGKEFVDVPLPTPQTVEIESVQAIGIQTLTQYLLPFELISLLLLVALIGAAYIARSVSSDSASKKA